jgi:hypothetical protein
MTVFGAERKLGSEIGSFRFAPIPAIRTTSNRRSSSRPSIERRDTRVNPRYGQEFLVVLSHAWGRDFDHELEWSKLCPVCCNCEHGDTVAVEFAVTYSGDVGQGFERVWTTAGNLDQRRIVKDHVGW